MIKIAIDGNEANVTNRVGSNVYAFEVLKALAGLPELREEAEVTVLLSAPPVADLPPVQPGWQYQVLKPRQLWTQFALPLHLWLNPRRYDVLYTPGHYAPRWSGIPYISSVMDVAYYEYPDQFRPNDLLQLREWTAYSVKRATKVVAISKATRAAIVKYLHRQLSDIVLGYPALPELVSDLTVKESKALEKKLQLQAPYFLYVGTLQPRKNVVRLVHAYERLIEKLQKNRRKAALPQLVLAGKIGWMAEETIAAVEQSPVRERIVLAGYVSEAEKQYLIQHATASVLVGLYEGFGIPPLESLRLGTIPVVSKTTSLPEVVGQAGILVDPLDEKDIAKGLETALTLTTRKKAELRKHGREQLAKFSWQQTANSIYLAIQRIVE